MATASLVVRIAGDISSLSAELKNAVNKVKGYASSLSSLGSSLSIGITAPVAAFGGVALKAAADIESLKLSLVAVTGSADKAEKQFAELQQVAKLPGLGLPEAIRGSVNLQAVGFAADKSKKILLEFGNALASVGRGREDLEEVIRQLGQMASRGKVTSDNLKPIFERVPQAARIVLREFGTIDTEVLQKMGVSAEKMTEVLLNGLGQLNRVSGGLKNDFENLKDSITIAFGEAGAAIAPFAKQFIDGFAIPAIEKLRMLSREFVALPAGFQGVTIAVIGLAAAAGPLAIAFAKVLEAIATIKVAMTGLSVASFAATGIYGALAAAAGYAGVGFLSAASAQTKVIRGVGEFNEVSDKLIKRLNAIGVSTKDLEAKFAEGKVSRQEFARELFELAKKYAPDTSEALGGLADSTAKVANAQAAAAEVVTKFNFRVTSQTIEAKKLSEMLSILNSKFQDGIRTLAELTLHIMSGKEGWLDYDATLDKIGDGIERTVEKVDNLGQVMRGHADLMKEVARTADPNLEGRVADVQNRQRRRRDQILLPIGKDQIKDQSKELASFQRQISTITTDLSRSLAKLIFQGGKFSQVMKDAFKSIAEALVRSGLEAAINSLAKKLFEVAGSLPGIGKGLAKVFGDGASSTVDRVKKSVPTIPSTDLAGNVAGAAASGITGIVGAVAGVATAISSIVGNFQMAGMNKSLDLIVNHTLRTANQLIEGIQPQVNMYLPKLADIHDRLRFMQDHWGSGGMLAAGAGGSNITINVNGISDPREVADEIYRMLKAKGI